MKNLKDCLEFFSAQQWPSQIALKSYDSSLAQLIGYLGTLCGFKNTVLAFSSLKETLESYGQKEQLFQEPRVYIMTQVPLTLTAEQKTLLEGFHAEDKLVLIGTSLFKDSWFRTWDKAVFYQADRSFLHSLGRHLSLSAECFRDVEEVTVEGLVELLRYEALGLNSKLLPCHWPSQSEYSKAFESFLSYSSAEDLTEKQLFQILNFIETLYLFSLAPEEKKSYFYLTPKIKAFLRSVPKADLKIYQRFFYLALEAAADHDLEKAKFYLTAWVKSLLQELPCDV